MPSARSAETLREIGATGLNLYGGWIYEEYLPELSGERGRRIFREMTEQDPVVGGIMFGIEMLLRQVPWQCVPADDSDKAAEVATFVQECINDLQPTWAETVSEILSMLQYGWSWFEVVYKMRDGKESRYSDGKIGWKKWAIRAQETLNGWEYDGQDLVAMKQLAPPDFREVRIPKTKSLHFRTKSRKDNPEGVSVLRNAYRPWYFKKHIETIEGIGVERDLAGLPVMWVPARLLSASATADDKALLTELKKVVTNIRRDEQEGLLMPLAYDAEGRDQYRLELLSSGGSRQFDTDRIVTRYDQRIAMTVMADFIMLGHENVGSYALSSDKTALFGLALGSWLDIIGTSIQSQELPRLLKINGIDLDLMPTLEHGDIESPDLGKLGDFLSKLAAAGAMLFPNPTLEKHLFESAGLPISEGGLAEDVPPQALPPASPEGAPPAEGNAPAPRAPARQQAQRSTAGQQSESTQRRAATEDDVQTWEQFFEERGWASTPSPFDDTSQQFWAGNVQKGTKGFLSTSSGPGGGPSHDTLHRYSPDGGATWSADRVSSVHNPILESIAAQPADISPTGPTLFMTGGGYGSGKSTLLDNFPEVVGFPSKGHATRVDPDKMKESIPEFFARTGKGDKTAASYVHEESSYLSKRGVAQALLSGKDTVYDTSGDSGAESLARKVQQFREKYGAVRVVGNYATPGSWAEAIRRVDGRAARAGAARRDIPHPAIVANHINVARTWLGSAKRGTFDELNLWSTAGKFGSPPTLIARAVGGKIHVFDPVAFDGFVNGGSEPWE